MDVKTLKSRSTEKHEVIDQKPYVLVFDRFEFSRFFFPVVFDCSVLDSGFFFFISIKIMWFFGLKPKAAFLLNWTLTYTMAWHYNNAV